MKIGIDLGGSHVAVGLINEENKILNKKEFYMNDNKNESFEEYIIKCICLGIKDVLLEEKVTIKEIEKIGIAAPGNPEKGVIKNMVNLGIKEFPIKARLEAIFNIPVKVQNDGICAGLAEKVTGSLKDYSNCVFLCVGTGVGGVLFLNNELVKKCSFEVGHMIINKDGETCKCGNKGCFEVYCSKRKFKNKILDILGVTNHPKAPEFTKLVNENMTPEIQKIIDEYVNDFVVGLANITNLLSPEAISIGGSLSHYKELIIDKVSEKISNGENLFNKNNPPKILVATNENEAGMIGAALL